MDEKLLTTNISIDTSFFEGQNFLVGSKIRELSELSATGSIKLFLTDITYQEIISRFQKNLSLTEEKIKKPKDQLLTNAKILRNFPEFEILFNLPIVDTSILHSRFTSDLENWIKKHKVNILTSGHITIKDVFKDYFEGNAPFKDAKKKHEFPDAFAVKTLEDHFSKVKEKSYLLTSDNDILDVKSDTLIPIQDSSILIDRIIRTIPEKIAEKAIKLLESEFPKCKKKLEESTRQMIIRAIEGEIMSTHSIDNLEVDGIDYTDVSDIEIKGFSIVYLNTNDFSFKLESVVEFSFEVGFVAQDYSEAWYDKEDEKWHFVETRTFHINDTYDIPVVIDGHFNTNENFVEMDIEDINNGKKLNVVASFRPWTH